jgi:hypothetical protein
MNDPVKQVPPVESMDDREISVSILWKATLALVILAGVIHVGLYVMDGAFSREAEKSGRKPTRLEAEGRGLPPEPRLQSTAARELADVRAEEERRLQGWEWASPAKTAARIPVERAMEIVAGRGVAPLAVLPVGSPASSSAEAPPPAAGAAR